MSARSKTLPEMPMEQIREVMARHPRVKCVVKRRNAKGHMSSLPSFQREAEELPSLEDYLREQFGGGNYRVQLRDPENEAEDLTTPFVLELEGQAKPVGRPANGTGSPGLPGRPPPFSYGRPAGIPSYSQMHGGGGGNDLEPSDFMSMTPDAIAMQQVNELRQQMREEKQERARERKEETSRLERERERARTLEREAIEARSVHERAMLELRMEMMAAVNQRPEPRAPTDYVGLAAAIVPVVTALITSSKDRQALAQTAQQRSAELAMESNKQMIATLTAGNKKGDDSTVKMLEVLVPLVLPFIQGMLDSKDPSKMVEILGSMGENQMATLSMVSQFVQQLAGESDNPWMDVAKQALSGIQNVAEQMVDLSGTKTATPGRSQVVRQQQQQPVTQAPPGGLGPHSSPRDFADALFASPQLPRELRTDQWHNIFIGLHDSKMPTHDAALQLCQHLEALADQDAFPEVFGDMMDSPKPASVFVGPFLEQLPLAQLNPVRMAAILREVDGIMVEADDPEDARQPVQVEQGFTPPAGEVFDTTAESVAEPVV